MYVGFKLDRCACATKSQRRCWPFTRDMQTVPAGVNTSQTDAKKWASKNLWSLHMDELEKEIGQR